MALYLECCFEKTPSSKRYKHTCPRSRTISEIWFALCKVCSTQLVYYRQTDVFGKQSDRLKANKHTKPYYLLLIRSGEAVEVLKPDDDKETRGRMVAGEYTQKIARPSDLTLNYLKAVERAERKPKRLLTKEPYHA